jgi:hypothetical protein
MNAAIMARVEMLKKDYGLTAKPAVDAAFYFDFAVRGIKAIA